MPPRPKDPSKTGPKTPGIRAVKEESEIRDDISHLNLDVNECAVKEEYEIGDGISNLNLDVNEARDPTNPVVSFSGQKPPRKLTEAQMAGDYSSSGGGHPQKASSSSKEACGPPGILIYAPIETIQIVVFPKYVIWPRIVGKQIVDKPADQNWNDNNILHVPDFRAEWGKDDVRSPNMRKADRFYVSPVDVPDFPQLHGWYVVFSLFEPTNYEISTHIIFQGAGRHYHQDIFIAKLGPANLQGCCSYVDMPPEFLSARSPSGYDLYFVVLDHSKTSMINSLIA